MANKYTKTPNPSKSELLLIYATGRTQQQIATIYKTTQKVVWRWFRDLGIKTRVPKTLNQRGELNGNWKGDKATYHAFHRRLDSKLGKPRYCETCKTTKAITYDWANLTGKYDDIKDFKRMCRSCHSKFDNKIKNITK